MRLSFLIPLLWSASALGKECGEADAKHWTTVVKVAAAPVTLHWTGVYEGRDSVCAISFTDSQGHLRTLSVWGQPQVNAAKSLIALASCADDGCDTTILVADIARGVVLKSALPLHDAQGYFSVAWEGSGSRLAVEVEGIPGQPPRRLTCSVADKIVCATRGL
jgi:hypothetical protein